MISGLQFELGTNGVTRDTRDDTDTSGDMANRDNPTTTDKASRDMDIRLFSPPSRDGSPWEKALDRYM